MRVLVDLDERDESGVGAGELQHAHFVQHLVATVLPLAPLPQELGGIVVSVALVAASLHHRELAPEKRNTGSPVSVIASDKTAF